MDSLEGRRVDGPAVAADVGMIDDEELRWSRSAGLSGVGDAEEIAIGDSDAVAGMLGRREGESGMYNNEKERKDYDEMLT